MKQGTTVPKKSYQLDIEKQLEVARRAWFLLQASKNRANPLHHAEICVCCAAMGDTIGTLEIALEILNDVGASVGLTEWPDQAERRWDAWVKELDPWEIKI